MSEKTAPGTAGEIKRYTVNNRTIALLMAIVAYQSGIPLNELRFRSFKEVSNEI